MKFKKLRQELRKALGTPENVYLMAQVVLQNHFFFLLLSKVKIHFILRRSVGNIGLIFTSKKSH